MVRWYEKELFRIGGQGFCLWKAKKKKKKRRKKKYKKIGSLFT